MIADVFAVHIERKLPFPIYILNAPQTTREKHKRLLEQLESSASHPTTSRLFSPFVTYGQGIHDLMPDQEYEAHRVGRLVFEKLFPASA